MPKWMIDCKAYSAMVSRQMDQPLSLMDRLRVRIHKWVCPPCRTVEEQFDTIRRACRWTPDQDNAPDKCDLSEEACRRIKSALKDLPK